MSKKLTARMQLKARGFTLIELMVTVAVVAILAAIAYPSYTQYIIRGKRSAAQAQMMDIANREQQYLLANRSYGDATALGYSLPADASANYDLAINAYVDTASGAPRFFITLTPKSTGSQRNDGWLKLDEQGNKTRQGGASW